MPGQGRIGDKAKGVDSHRCNACPHVVSGPATQGSSDVIVNGKPAVRKGDSGVHAACCGSNTWTANEGSDTVFFNGKQAFRLGDDTDHCGGAGMLVEASGNVFVGNSQAPAFIEAAKSHAPFVCNCSQPTGVPYNESNENLIQRTKHLLKDRLDERGTDNYAKGHKAAAFIDAVGSTMLDDIPETAGAAAIGMGTDLIVGKAFKILGKGAKLLWQNMGKLSEPVRTRLRSVLHKAESGHALTGADQNVVIEALGEVGGQKALARQGIEPEEGFVNRYHGPDHMGRDAEGNLVETEFKGLTNDSSWLPESADGNKQLSKANNKTRANKMRRKAKKVGNTSNRIGGPYNEDEIDFWEQVFLNDGQKNLMSTHTNVETGTVHVFERDLKGEIANQIDSFNIYED